MLAQRQYWVYIMTNKGNKVLYTGVTGDLRQRAQQHKEGRSGFSAKYNTDKLVYAEPFSDINQAVGREKQLKAGSRQNKVDLIDGLNPRWRDLSDDLW